MKQIIINYLFIFGLPVIIGLAVRIILQRFNKAYLVTTLFAILTAIGWYIANAMPSYGSELHGILAIQTTVVFVSSLLTGLILRLKKKDFVNQQINCIFKVCNCKILFDPLLTQNRIRTGRVGREQWKIRRANGGKKHKLEPK